MSSKNIAIIVGGVLGGTFGLLFVAIGVAIYVYLRRKRVAKRASVFPQSADVFAVSGESYAHSPTLKDEAVFVYVRTPYIFSVLYSHFC